MIGEAVPPQADDPRLYADFLGDRSGAATSRRQQNNPGSLQITLQCHRRSATSFQHRAILPRNADFSCFGNHPDLEYDYVPRKAGTSQRKALLAQFGDELVVRVQDGRGVGRIAGRQAQLGAIDRRQRRFAARWPDHNVGNAVARAGRDLEGEGNRIVVGPCIDGVESRRLGDRPAVDRGAYLGIIVAARAQRAVDPRQGRLGALQKAQAVARQRLLLLESLDELLEIGLHALVSADGKNDLRCPSVGRPARQHCQHCSQRQKATHPCQIVGVVTPIGTGSAASNHVYHTTTLREGSYAGENSGYCWKSRPPSPCSGPAPSSA